MSTIMEVLQKSPDIAIKEYQKITIDNRIGKLYLLILEERRKYIKSDPLKYEDLVLYYNEQIELILEDA